MDLLTGVCHGPRSSCAVFWSSGHARQSSISQHCCRDGRWIPQELGQEGQGRCDGGHLEIALQREPAVFDSKWFTIRVKVARMTEPDETPSMEAILRRIRDQYTEEPLRSSPGENKVAPDQTVLSAVSTTSGNCTAFGGN